MNHIPSIATNLRGVYRFGFNGQEKDDEVTGQTGSVYTAQFWEYDSRIGRRWNLDPKPNPSISFYATFANNPVWFCDLKGDTVKYTNLETESLIKNAINSDEILKSQIALLDASDVVYEYNYKGEIDLYEEGSKSTTTTDGSKVLINFYTYKRYDELINGSLDAFYHETEHALQFEHGEIGFVQIKGKWIPDDTYDITDEVKAFEAGLNAPGTDEFAKKSFHSKSLWQKISYVGNKGPDYNKMAKIGKEKLSNGENPEKNEQSNEGEQKLFKGSNGNNGRFYKTFKPR